MSFSVNAPTSTSQTAQDNSFTQALDSQNSLAGLLMKTATSFVGRNGNPLALFSKNVGSFAAAHPSAARMARKPAVPRTTMDPMNRPVKADVMELNSHLPDTYKYALSLPVRAELRDPFSRSITRQSRQADYIAGHEVNLNLPEAQKERVADIINQLIDLSSELKSASLSKQNTFYKARHEALNKELQELTGKRIAVNPSYMNDKKNIPGKPVFINYAALVAQTRNELVK